ncbi:MAG: endonuclease [Myxococcales bacterium]|nr:endonuclease [Myxococcales bacterium]
MAPGASALRLVTYNVHRCVGADGSGSVERIGQVLAELGGDVIAVQEVVSSERVPSPGQLERLADASGRVAVPGGTLVEGDGRYGNGLLTRHPVRSVERHDLSIQGAEPRGALEVVLDLPCGPARVIATHLGLRARERSAQIEGLAAILVARPEPVLALLGDMNEWRRRPFRDPLEVLSRGLLPVPIARTFPARRPVVALDRIFIGPDFRLIDSGAHRSALSRVASDHLPLFAEVEPAGEA